MDQPRYPYSALPSRPPLRWPGDARVAFWVGLNVEHFRPDRPTSDRRWEGPHPDVDGIAQRDYGPRVGIWRLASILEKYGVRPTAALNSDVCHLYPDIIEVGRRLGWEWMAHGRTNSETLEGMAEGEERATIAEVIDTIHAATGSRPKGWLGPGLVETSRTLDLLSEAGLTYVCDWSADEQPFSMRVRTGSMISVPYTRELHDLAVFGRRGQTPREFFETVVDQFDVLHADGAASGRVMSIALHPYVAGHPFRARWVERAIEYVTTRQDVWVTTAGEIADWYLRSY
jgi:peptidoglycan/xylan/chitin deacetylase (PgdA/CDA1 family)